VLQPIQVSQAHHYGYGYDKEIDLSSINRQNIMMMLPGQTVFDDIRIFGGRIYLIVEWLATS
jgi:hypothetical protein